MAMRAEYCPIAVGTEVFADRWTPLILRELIIGATRFNQIERGLPGISRSLLSTRLRDMETAGIIERLEDDGGYRLTAAGRDLEPIVWALGEWAIRWTLSDPTPGQLDNNHLLWRMQCAVCPETAPIARTVVQFDLAGPGRELSRYWLLLEGHEATVCQRDPGGDPSLCVSATSDVLHRWWMGWVTWAEALRSRAIVLDGQPAAAKAFPKWFHLSPFAPSVRRAVKRVR